MTDRKPRARQENLVVEELGAELLIYDQAANRAHSLGPEAAAVWRACDGETSRETLSAKAGLDEDTVACALDELHACNLLDSPPQLASGITRRDLTVRAAKVSAAAASVPLIWSITGPIPEAAATPPPEACLFYTDTSCDACDKICGCCCCCQGKGTANHTPSCKLCYPSRLCASFQCPGEKNHCPKLPGETGQDGCGHCSTTPPEQPPGCTPPGAAFNCKSTGQPPVGNPPRCCTY